MKKLRAWFRRVPRVDVPGAEVLVDGRRMTVTEVNVVRDATGAIVQLGCEDKELRKTRAPRSNMPPAWGAGDDEIPWWREEERG